jgi:hypothetical protein
MTTLPTKTVHVCQNCAHEHNEAQLLEIKNIYLRVDPGELYPSGECPDCGAVCHPEERYTEPTFTFEFTVTQSPTFTIKLHIDARNVEGALNRLNELRNEGRQVCVPKSILRDVEINLNLTAAAHMTAITGPCHATTKKTFHNVKDFEAFLKTHKHHRLVHADS